MHDLLPVVRMLEDDGDTCIELILWSAPRSGTYPLEGPCQHADRPTAAGLLGCLFHRIGVRECKQSTNILYMFLSDLAKVVVGDGRPKSKREEPIARRVKPWMCIAVGMSDISAKVSLL